MIKDILEQLAPLDAQIAALKGSGSDMEAITAHASELAELAVEEDEILRSCGPLTAEDRVFLARHPERPHIDETIFEIFLGSVRLNATFANAGSNIPLPI